MEDIQLTEDQYNASVAFTDFLIDQDQKYMVIQGSAGTGKSTLTTHLIDTVHSRLKLYSLLMGKKSSTEDFSIELTATTNKAAVVLSEMTGYEPQTIYSCLHLEPREDYNTGELHFVKGKDFKPLYNKLIIIDEGSFIDDNLLSKIDNATINCKILIIGDQYQLPPVKQQVPVMDRLGCPKATLDKVMRHGGVIAEAGAAYRAVVKAFTENAKRFSVAQEPIPIVWPDLKSDGKNIIHVDGPTFKDMVDKAFLDPDFTPSKARVLAWTNDKVQLYNNHIRKILGHKPYLGPGDVLTTNKPIRVINKHRCSATLYTTDAQVSIAEVRDQVEELEGILGHIVELDSGYEFFLPHNQLEVSALLKKLAKKKEWRLFWEIKNNWLDLRPVFASTVHKSQGSTYETVFINLTDIGKCSVPSDVARMLYVAITRAAKKVVLYGELPPQYRGN